MSTDNQDNIDLDLPEDLQGIQDEDMALLNDNDGEEDNQRVTPEGQVRLRPENCYRNIKSFSGTARRREPDGWSHQTSETTAVWTKIQETKGKTTRGNIFRNLYLQ